LAKRFYLVEFNEKGMPNVTSNSLSFENE